MMTFLTQLPDSLSVAMNPCLCGFYGDLLKPCTCAAGLVTKYQKRISGPLLDRIDIHIEVPRVDYEKLSGDRLGESSETIRNRVQTAREIQQARFSSLRMSSATPICASERYDNFAGCRTRVRV
jgi:magnesium chelatase family protein